MILQKHEDSLTCRKIDINDLVRQAKQKFIEEFVKSNININGQEIKLTTSKTRFGGERLWFICPKCLKKKGMIYAYGSSIKCGGCYYV